MCGPCWPRLMMAVEASMAVCMQNEILLLLHGAGHELCSIPFPAYGIKFDADRVEHLSKPIQSQQGISSPLLAQEKTLHLFLSCKCMPRMLTRNIFHGPNVMSSPTLHLLPLSHFAQAV